MSTTTATAPVYPPPKVLADVAQRFARETKVALETFENTIGAVGKAHEYEETLVHPDSAVTYDYLGRFTAFVKSLEDDIGEVQRRVDAASELVRQLAMAAEFAGPDA